MDTALDGYRVLDLCDEKGMLCGRILGDLGADVVKIERPGGDPARRRGPFFQDIPDPERSLFWLHYNANKRGITLDIESEDGRALLRRLVAAADFLIESYAPGHLLSLGLDYESLHALNHRLVVTSITPFAEGSADADFAATDMTVWAMGGRMYLDGQADHPPVRIPGFQAFNHAGAQAAAGSLMAHYGRLTTGRGQHVSVSMQECVTWTLQSAVMSWELLHHNDSRSRAPGFFGGKSPPQLWPCKDGHVVWQLRAGGGGSRSTHRLVEMMGEDGMDGEVANVNWDEVVYRDLSDEECARYENAFRRFFRTKTKQQLFDEGGLSASIAPVQTMEDIENSPQTIARRAIVDVEHEHLQTNLRFVSTGLHFSETPLTMARRAPMLGEHNVQIYVRELGLSREDLRVLAERGVV